MSGGKGDVETLERILKRAGERREESTCRGAEKHGGRELAATDSDPWPAVMMSWFTAAAAGRGTDVLLVVRQHRAGARPYEHRPGYLHSSAVV